MAEKYVSVNGGDVYGLAPDFDDLSEAVAFASLHSIPGAIQTLAEYSLTAPYLDALADGLKNVLRSSLIAEGTLRVRALNPAVSIDAAMALHLAGSTIAVALIAATVDATIPIIDALPDVAAAEAYDVTTDPSWP